MKKYLLSALKIGLPIFIGLSLIYMMYDGLSPDQRSALFSAFRNADYLFLILSMIIGFASHLMRARRWQFLLHPMGYQTSLWNAYHSVMIGYIINLILPRAGEAARSAYLQKYTGVPFQKSFGTIVAERAIDVVLLGVVALITLGLQLGSFEEVYQAIINSPLIENISDNSMMKIIGAVIKYLIILGFFGALALAIFKASFRLKFIEFIKGILEGLWMVWKTPHKIKYFVYSILIWVFYIAMFWITFLCYPETGNVPMSGVFMAFIGGTLGFIVVQGGIGVYPIIVGIIVTIYMGIQPNPVDATALALGWILWGGQTIMMIVLGLISLLLMPKMNQNESNESTRK